VDAAPFLFSAAAIGALTDAERVVAVADRHGDKIRLLAAQFANNAPSLVDRRLLPVVNGQLMDQKTEGKTSLNSIDIGGANVVSETGFDGQKKPAISDSPKTLGALGPKADAD
jgi:hypothetical protein